MQLVMEQYTKKIKDKVILDGVNLTLNSGNIYGLRGINGSGKTMLIRAICGLIYPTQGRVVIDGEELGKDISFPRSVGVLIESPAFLPDHTGLENLRLIAAIKQQATEQDLRQALLDVGLQPEDKRTFKKYSLGMKQKLGIAAALMEKPEMIILDEPFNALDDGSVEKTKQLILREKARGALVILACHDLAALESLSDEIVFIEEGKIARVEQQKGAEHEDHENR